MTRLPALGPRGEGWVLIQGVLLVLVATAGWALGPDWSGPLRFAGIIAGVLLFAGGVLLGVRAVVHLDGYNQIPYLTGQQERQYFDAQLFVRHRFARLFVARGKEQRQQVRTVGAALTPLPRPGDQAELIETGAFALVRHPIYGGLILAAFGWAVVQASIVAVTLAAVLAAFFRLKSAREEAWLETRFPGYPAYRARTPRFIPRIVRSPARRIAAARLVNAPAAIRFPMELGSWCVFARDFSRMA